MRRCLAAGFVSFALIAAPALAQSTTPAAAEAEPAEESRDGPSLFDDAEPIVAVSPATAIAFQLPAGTLVTDFEVSPVGDEVAVVTADQAHHQQIAFWRYQAAFARAIDIPADTHVTALTWQPKGKSLFLLATRGANSVILKLDPAAAGFIPATVLTSTNPLRRLVVGPRPFLMTDNKPAYRLFFGERQPNGTYALRSVSDAGNTVYSVVGPRADATYKGQDPEVSPHTTIAPSALPVGFHPVGNILIWEDEKSCLHRISYNLDNWGQTEAFGAACGKFVAYTPNGAATLEWASKVPGLRFHGLFDGADRTILSDYMLDSVPSQAPDGRGVVAVTTDAGAKTLRYLPVDTPLANVANAWMYLGSAGDQKRFTEDRGLFRPRTEDEQLYQLYDSESYYCGGPDARVPTRPYYVTTDLFWELYGAAFDGLFIVLERNQAMPAFERFLYAASNELKAKQPDSRLAKAFAAARATYDDQAAGDPEAQLIVAAQGSAQSPVIAEPLDYAQFKPRGHYKTDPQKRYFRAMRYLSQLRVTDEEAATLKGLSPATLGSADAWIATYRAFIASSRADVVLGRGLAKSQIASHPGAPGGRLFPLSWGWDNEALDNTIFHQDWPAAEQIADRAGGDRMLPSGLDFAAIAGDALAYRLLDQDGTLAQYPNLAPRLAALKNRFAEAARHPAGTLYDQWLGALATQWADSAAAPPVSGPVWDAKRLQTGLASWATLRHATVLVNDQSAAECGEAGFEAIVMRPPRGYVEPDPQAFAAIAGLFDSTIAIVRASRLVMGDDKANTQLRDGIVRRLTESRDNVIKYQKIAEKELKGEPLSSDDYDSIQFVGRAAEHNFLIFMSLSNPDYALSTPDPMMKIADVAGASGTAGSLETAVGRPLEWDQIVPFFGRAQIVKGSVYSYYEFAADRPLDDAQWRKSVDNRKRPDWVSRFVSDAKLSCPAEER